MAFKTFPCDKEAIEGESFLRADYSLSCNSDKHTYFKVYAGFMIVVSNRTLFGSFAVDNTCG